MHVRCVQPASGHHRMTQLNVTACFVFLLCTFLALPLSMAFTGMKFLEDCPIQPLIPLYLLVGGIIGALKNSFPEAQRC
ncbi:transmembrane protein 272-like [Eubalaena glacialis]|uniref:transmembrane protein 272-like n=1 Tax=Eubalaena glacialis TaxID=27606 RepID=UPI002A5A40C1|nr:transmembrane protein 272-like [Eubalaena glacialis]